MAFDTKHWFSTGFKRLFNRIDYLSSLLCMINRLLSDTVRITCREASNLSITARGVGLSYILVYSDVCFFTTLQSFLLNVKLNLTLCPECIDQTVVSNAWVSTRLQLQTWDRVLLRGRPWSAAYSTPKVSIHSDCLFVLVIFCCQWTVLTNTILASASVAVNLLNSLTLKDLTVQFALLCPLLF